MARPRRRRLEAIQGIQDDTPIVPHIVADTVINEVERCFPLNMGRVEARALADKLADRANLVYKKDENFRRRIRGRGNSGRDMLYAFMRHWLTAELAKSRPDIYRRLPSDFAVGQPLVCPVRKRARR